MLIKGRKYVGAVKETTKPDEWQCESALQTEPNMYILADLQIGQGTTVHIMTVT